MKTLDDLELSRTEIEFIIDEYFNVTSTDIINVPCGCCLNVSVENVSEAPPGGVAPAINVQNANLTVTKIM